jgi:hypothetical protein
VSYDDHRAARDDVARAAAVCGTTPRWISTAGSAARGWRSACALLDEVARHVRDFNDETRRVTVDVCTRVAEPPAGGPQSAVAAPARRGRNNDRSAAEPYTSTPTDTWETPASRVTESAC